MTVDEIRKSAAEIEDEVNRLYERWLREIEQRRRERLRMMVAVVFAAALGLAAAIIVAVGL